MSPFRHLYDACNVPGAVPAFPRIIDVEVTSSCNFRCLMCPTGNLSLGRKAEFMTGEVFRALVEECAEHGTAIRFIGWGEPLLHPRVAEFVRLASTRSLLTHLNTNASRLSVEMAEALVDAGLSSIKFSFQGVDRESYAAMRKRDYYRQMLDAIARMREARGHRTWPWIAASTSVTDETDERIAAFRDELSPLVDELSIGETIFGFMDLDAVRVNDADKGRLAEYMAREDGADLRHPDPCPEVYDKLSIHADGSGVVCCNDFSGHTHLGRLPGETVAEMWRHPTLLAYRERLDDKRYEGPLCGSCWDYMELTGG